MSRSRLPPLRLGVLTVDDGPGAVVFEPVSGDLHLLSPQAAVVLDGCREGWALGDLVTAIAELSGASEPDVRAQVADCVEDLRRHGVVGEDVGSPPEAAGSGRPSQARTGATMPPQRAGAHPPGVRSRALRVLDEVVVFRSAGRAIIEWVDEVFVDLAVDEPATALCDLEVRADDHVWLRSDHPAFARFDQAGVLPADLPTVLNAVAAGSMTCLAFHAGMVRSPGGTTVALLGEPDAGKSTLVGGLVQAGWAYLSDEIAAVELGSRDLVPYPKPPMLSPASRSVLGLAADAPPVLRADHLRPGAAVPLAERPPLDHFVVVSYRADRPTAVSVVAELDRLSTLAPHLLNLRRTGRPGLETLVHLARTLPLHRLDRADLDDGVRAIAALTNRESA